MFKNIEKHLHHAYLCIGEPEHVHESLCSFLEKKHGVRMTGNPDINRQESASFGIDEARALKEWASRKAYAERKFAIVSCTTITREAQNALLKLLEEPPSETHFFVIAPSEETFLPTLRSRCVVLRDDARALSTPSNNTRTFLSSPMSARMEMVKEIADAKDKHRALQFVSDIERALYQNASRKEHAAAFADILMCKKYLYDRAPSVKMLLEHIALVAPTIK